MKCLGNYKKTNRHIYDKASSLSGQHVIWKDEPDDRLTGDRRKEFGSLWSAREDLSDFWRIVRQLDEKETT